jgi:hypothetical protein
VSDGKAKNERQDVSSNDDDDDDDDDENEPNEEANREDDPQADQSADAKAARADSCSDRAGDLPPRAQLLRPGEPRHGQLHRPGPELPWLAAVLRGRRERLALLPVRERVPHVLPELGLHQFGPEREVRSHRQLRVRQAWPIY